mmetsp:Transcript_50366/g.129743  ORF Transcript_50366/g.129743 Transcript_50366/m.129743 type:complete len:777 (-) Transcript_50366:175-2505(-)
MLEVEKKAFSLCAAERVEALTDLLSTYRDLLYSRNYLDETLLHVSAAVPSPVLCEVILAVEERHRREQEDEAAASASTGRKGGPPIVLRQRLVHFRDKKKRTPLHRAASVFSAATCQLLLVHGSDPTVLDEDKCCPLHIFARSLPLRGEGDDDHDLTLLDGKRGSRAGKGNAGEVEENERHRKGINSEGSFSGIDRNSSFGTLFFSFLRDMHSMQKRASVCYSSSLTEMEVLAEQIRARVNLHGRHLRELLVRREKEERSQTKRWDTLRAYAKQVRVSLSKAQAGAQRGDTARKSAISDTYHRGPEGNHSYDQVLHRFQGASEKGYVGLSPHTACLLVLLESGADKDRKDGYGRTAFHTVCQKGWLEGTRILLSYGVTVSTSDHLGSTPVHEAVEGGYEDIVEVLCRESLGREEEKVGRDKQREERKEKGGRGGTSTEQVRHRAARQGVTGTRQQRTRYSLIPIESDSDSDSDLDMSDSLSLNALEAVDIETVDDMIERERKEEERKVAERRQKALSSSSASASAVSASGGGGGETAASDYAAYSSFDVFTFIFSSSPLNFVFAPLHHRPLLKLQADVTGMGVGEGGQRYSRGALKRGRVDLNSRDEEGRRPLYLAINKGHSAVTSLLLLFGAHPDGSPTLTLDEERENTHLLWAYANGYWICGLALLYCGVHVDSTVYEEVWKEWKMMEGPPAHTAKGKEKSGEESHQLSRSAHAHSHSQLSKEKEFIQLCLRLYNKQRVVEYMWAAQPKSGSYLRLLPPHLLTIVMEQYIKLLK